MRAKRVWSLDVETSIALAQEAKRVEEAYLRVLARQAELREKEHPSLNDGIARIASVNENVFAPALAEVWTDPQQEKLVVFDRDVLNTLKIAERAGRLVRTKLRRTSGSRCIWSASLLPPVDWQLPYPCVYCGYDATFTEKGHVCSRCHALMPRSL